MLLQFSIVLIFDVVAMDFIRRTWKMSFFM